MADVRDDGIAALEQGDDVTAVALLSEACRLDPDDFPAHLGLGQVLLRTAQVHEAVVMLERAVALAPPSPDARRELGFALAAAGRTHEAIRTLQHALTLRPNDRPALEALGCLSRQSSAPRELSPPAYSAIVRRLSLDPDASDAVAVSHPGERNDAYGRHTPLSAPSAEADEPTQPLPAVAEGGLLRGGVTGHEPTLYVMPPSLRQPVAAPSIPYYGFPATTPGPAGVPYGGPPWGAGTVEPEAGRHDDEFSVLDGYYELLEILAAPCDFFYAQIGREGSRAPLAMLVAYALNIAIGLLALLFTTGARLGPSGMFVVLLSPIWLLLLTIALAVVAVGGATALHVACALFRGRASYSGSFRAAVYSAAPVCTAVAVGLILLPVKPHDGPVASFLATLPYALALIAPLWSVLLLGVALRYIHALPWRAVIATLVLLMAISVGCGFALSLLPTWS